MLSIIPAEASGTEVLVKREGKTWIASWENRSVKVPFSTVETLLGLHLEVDHLRITPCIPNQWESYKIHYRFRETFYHITVKRADKISEGTIRVRVDGVLSEGTGLNDMKRPHGMVPLVDDRQDHHVEVYIG